MKGGNRRGNCNGSRRSSNSNNNPSSSSNNNEGLQEQLQQLSSTSPGQGGAESRGTGVSAGATDEENEGSSTMYEINTCSRRNCNPSHKSKSSSSGEELEESPSDSSARAGFVGGDKLDKVGNTVAGCVVDGLGEELLFLDMSYLKRLYQKFIPVSCSRSRKALASSSSSPSRCHRGQRKSSPASGGGGESAKEERCDENLNEFYVVQIIVTIVCYLNGLNGDFVHDDIPAITMNKDVLALNPTTALFKNDFWGTAMSDVSSHKSYRPLTTVSFR